MKLSPHFTLEEFLVSDTAARRGIANDPPPEVIKALEKTALGLEAVRVRLDNAPILITSGYRSPALNKAVGGSPNSQHMRGEAVDFICPAFGTAADVCAALLGSGIKFDQLINEFSKWTHISFSSLPRGQALEIYKTGTHPLRS